MRDVGLGKTSWLAMGVGAGRAKLQTRCDVGDDDAGLALEQPGL